MVAAGERVWLPPPPPLPPLPPLPAPPPLATATVALG